MTQQITPLPEPPSRQDPVNFSARGDAFLGGLPLFATEANALANEVNSNAVLAQASATTAQTAATSAIGAANYKGEYSSGTTYQIGHSCSYAEKLWVAKTINTAITPSVGVKWLLIVTTDLAQLHAVALSF